MQNKNVKEIKTAFAERMFNELLNVYTEEQLVMGRIKQGDNMPVDAFFKDCEITNDAMRRITLNNFNGTAIDKNGKVRNKPTQEYFKSFYYSRMNANFIETPAVSDDYDQDGLFMFCDEVREFITECYSLFVDVLMQDVPCKTEDLNISETARNVYGSSTVIAETLATAMAENLQRGDKLEWDIVYASYFPQPVQDIIAKSESGYTLQCADVNCLDFKLALLSVIGFRSLENAVLFESKIMAYKEANR